MTSIFKPRISKARAVEWAGSAAELAVRLGISQSAVSQWEDEIPEGRLWQLHALGCPDDQPDDQPNDQ